MHTSFFFFNDTATTEIYTLSLHDALPISTVQPAVSVSRKRVGFHRGTHTHQVPVPVGAVHAPDGGPDLVVAGPLGGEGGALARVRPVPRVGDHVREGVRRVREHVVAARLLALLDVADLLADRGEGVAKAGGLLLRLALGGLGH